MSKQVIKEKILDLLKKVNWLTYVQLMNYLKNEGIEPVGNFNIGFTDKNVIFWGGLSEEVVEAMTELLNEQIIGHFPASQEIYTVDKIAFNIPIANDVPEVAFKELHMIISHIRLMPTEKEEVKI